MLEFINTLGTGDNFLYNEVAVDGNSLINKICDKQISEYADRLMLLTGITNITMEDIHIRKLIDIFMITSDDNDIIFLNEFTYKSRMYHNSSDFISILDVQI